MTQTAYLATSKPAVEARARVGGVQVAAEGIWARVPGLIDRAPSLDALRAHGLHLMAGSLWRSRGSEVPSVLREEERRAAKRALAGVAVLRQARSLYGGRLMLMKGPEVAARYPEPGTRDFIDIDLLADDADAAQRALVAAGFIDDRYRDRDHSKTQHLDPLAHPGLGLIVEIHRRPNSPRGLAAPGAEELLSLAVPSATGIDGLLAPSPGAHALLLAAHAWAHHPLGRIGDLIDVLAILPPGGRHEAALLARRWGWERMWRTTLSAADALLGSGPEPLALRTWARHLGAVRELSVLDNHVIRLIAPCSALPRRQVPRGVATALRGYADLNPGERWPTKLARTALAVRDAFTNKSQHNRRVGVNPWHR
jgi:Uncharacterised nucleotidyltransferase